MKIKSKIALGMCAFVLTATFFSNDAKAICREFFGGGGHICCFYGGSGCVNGVNDETKGPYYYYQDGLITNGSGDVIEDPAGGGLN